MCYHPAAMITLVEAKDRRALREFVRYPFQLYRNSQNWIPPLITDELATLSRDKTPAYHYCDARLWLAKRNGKTVGRIAAIRNDKANGKWGEKRLRFGCSGQ